VKDQSRRQEMFVLGEEYFSSAFTASSFSLFAFISALRAEMWD
jgi:hypothetical protein